MLKMNSLILKSSKYEYLLKKRHSFQRLVRMNDDSQNWTANITKDDVT